MSYLDDLLGKIIRFGGNNLPQRKILNFVGTGVTAADNPSTGQTDVTINSGSVADSAVTTAKIADAAVTGPKIANGTVSLNKIANSAGLSVLGRASIGTGILGDIIASIDGQVLRRSGGSVGFGEIATAGIANLAVTTAKVADDAVTGPKLRLANASPLRARNAANNADVNLMRLTAGDLLDFETVCLIGSASSNENLASAGAISLTVMRSNLTGAGTYTLAGGTQGQVKFITNNVGAGTAIDVTATGITFVIGAGGLAVVWFTGSTWALIGGRRVATTETFAAAGTWGGISTHIRCTGTTYTINAPTTGSGQQVLVENAASGAVTFGGQSMATGTYYLYTYLNGGWRRTALT